jgi:glutamate dehydrogenase
MGASPTQGDYDQRTPLHLAACAGSLDCAKLLVEAGATLSQDRFGCLPIHDAVRSGHREVANYLRMLDINTGMTEDAIKSRVFGLIVREGVFSMATVQSELGYFFDLGLHHSYFERFSLAETAHHIHCLIAAKCSALITNSKRVHFAISGESSATFMTTLEHARETEEQLTAYLENQDNGLSLDSMISYCSKKPAMLGGETPLVIHHVSRNPLSEHHKAAGALLNEDDLQLVGSTDFLRSVTKEKLSAYQNLMLKVLDSKSAVIQQMPLDDNEVGTVTVIFGHYNPGGRPCVKEVLQIFRLYNTTPLVFRRECFANGVTIFDMNFSTQNMQVVSNVVSTLPVVPFLGTIPKEGRIVVELAMNSSIPFEQAQWIIAVGKFCFHFYPKDTPGYLELCRRFKHDPEGQAHLDELYLKTMAELIQEERIYEVLVGYPKIVNQAYQDFVNIAKGHKEPFYNEELATEIRSTVTDQTARVILLDCLLKFNHYLRMTNFFKCSDARPGTATEKRGTKTTVVPMALAYRFDGSFLETANKNLYPEAPYAVYMIVGRGFYGFHSRFRDVARGGIRVIRSRNEQVYKINASRLYEEAYNLALTQQKKNKDIPEGGSKGTILLAPTHQSDYSSRVCFIGYIDALLDCMLASHHQIHSWLPSQELLFFGPDENTAGFMDLGALRAKRRGYPFWKALTTGKSTKLGGIPHDTYGMTTSSVHQYVIRLLEELGLKEEGITKVQTGGPDGDLGSNEILMSKDRTIGIVDGSGVLCDPRGLDREELTRLAKARVPICNFNRRHLSEDGFMVLINDLNVTLPDGTTIASGVELRDTFHLSKYATADLFVPCGGRPCAVHSGNVKQMFNADGSAKFKFIVEGANLFFTADARKVLENAGVKLFKDASTNKGGVTSSSLEVFASLAMNSDDHTNNMCVEVGETPPEFYEDYANDILNIVRRNADSEFKIVWKEMLQGRSSMESTDRLSAKINFLTDTIFRDLDESKDRIVIEKVLKTAIPQKFLNHVGFDNIWKNTPRNYLIAMVATNLAAKYVYENGMDASEFKFYNYLKGISQS